MATGLSARDPPLDTSDSAPRTLLQEETLFEEEEEDEFEDPAPDVTVEELEAAVAKGVFPPRASPNSTCPRSAG